MRFVLTLLVGAFPAVASAASLPSPSFLNLTLTGSLTIGGSVVTGVGTTAGTLAAGNDSRITGAVQAAGGDASAATVKATGGTTARTLADRAAEPLSAKDFGAVLNGVADDTAAVTTALRSLPNGTPGLIRFDGAPNIGVQIDARGADPYCLIRPQDRVADGVYPGLPCALIRPNKIERSTFGYGDNAAVYSIIANQPAETAAGVGPAPSNILTYPTKDSVALYNSNVGPPTVASQAATFTATTAVPSVPLTIGARSQLRVGMWIEAIDATSTKYSGQIASWAADGSSVTVNGWTKLGNISAGQVPSGTGTINVGAISKVWAQNAVVTLNPNSYADQAAGIEADTVNQIADYVPATGAHTLWGFDAYNAGTYMSAFGHVARGNFWNDFEAQGPTNAGFHVSATGAPPYGFMSEQTTGHAFATVRGSAVTSYTDSNGVRMLGANGYPAVDYFRGVGSAAYDVAFSVTGGTGTAGQGLLSITAGGGMTTSGTFTSSGLTDNGTSTFSGLITGNAGMTLNGGNLNVVGAANNIGVGGSAAGSPVTVQAFGGDANISVNLVAKGSGTIQANTRYNAPLHTPATSSEACSTGDFVDDANYHYVCTATNTWKRVALVSF